MDKICLNMKKYLMSVCLLLAAAPLWAGADAGKIPMSQVIDKGLATATAHALRMAKALEKEEGRLPKCTKDGRLVTSDYSWWCSGFFPGELWYLYENCRSAELKKYAELYTDRVEPAKNKRTTHDLGFMLNCSFGNGWRLTGNPRYREVMLTGARTLARRYNERVGLIRSWDFNSRQWQYPVIIDNMMNLEFLMWAGKELKDDRFCDMAVSHARKTKKYHFRDDYSCFHVVSYDTLTGKPHVRQTHQGLADNSAWARGQAWALYGYTMMYRESGRKEFLRQARHVADYLMHHPAMPADKVPYWDFDDPKIPDVPRDASAAAIMASALIELSELTGGKDGEAYLAFAEDQLRSLTSPEYLAPVGYNANFALMHSTGNMPSKSEVDVPLSYADYYYVEALIRLKRHYGIPALPSGQDDRQVWVREAVRIMHPVLYHLSRNTLKKNMPYHGTEYRHQFAHLEAVGRLICGIAPWLEQGPDETEEGRLRAKYIDMAVKGLANAVDPSAPDYLAFARPYQSLVDAAFLAEGLLRAPRQLWGNMDAVTRERMLTELRRSRSIKPFENNWLLFASVIEAALLEYGGECDEARLTYGVEKFRNQWYKGDGLYGDGPSYHQDYYNSFVINPMLTDVLRVMKKHGIKGADFLPKQEQRLSRYAAILERMISPEGAYPCVGRSITYRFGAFHALAQASLLHLLPGNVSPAQVRCALTAVIRRQMSAPWTYDADGWLTVGYAGAQRGMAEEYINTGSEYLCSFGLLPLGLPASDPFWSEPYTEWTGLKAWKGIDVPADHAL